MNNKFLSPPVPITVITGFSSIIIARIVSSYTPRNRAYSLIIYFNVS
jgi:hypothetical protein